MTFNKRVKRTGDLTRREFMHSGGAFAGASLLAGRTGAQMKTASRNSSRLNILLVMTDQQGLDTISAVSAGGCEWVSTPNLDRLAARGTSFMRSYSTNPVCSPARSSIFTGRPTCETGVIANGFGIREEIPNLGQILRPAGYETIYCGKWHVPRPQTVNIAGFTVIPGGLGGQGTLGDQAISSACEAYLHTRDRSRPFCLVASFLQPHDICNWISRNLELPDKLPYPEILDELPPLPPNFGARPEEPQKAKPSRKPVGKWSPEQWRYYLWSYYRMVEEVDHEIGRVLDALEATGQLENTLVIFTSDHGEGRARHQTVTKNYFYDQAAAVPLILALPGRIAEGATDSTHLASGLDIVPTICDYAGVVAPRGIRGHSLKRILDDTGAEWRDFVVSEVRKDSGRMLRTPQFKLVAYRDDLVRQLFDMENDPWETRNLINDSQYGDTVTELTRALNQWEGLLEQAPNALPQFEIDA